MTPQAPPTTEGAVAWRYRSKSGTSDWMVTQGPNMGDWPNLIVEPLYAHPQPVQDAGMRKKVAVICARARGVQNGPKPGDYRTADAILAALPAVGEKP